MAATIMQVARTLGQISGWSLSNLELQKIAYIAEMIHLGRTGAPLVDENWQAWNYGPVQPALYHKAKVFGTSPVKDIFNASTLDEGSQFKAINDAYQIMKKMNPGQMVAVTHRPNGAWSKHFNTARRGVVIPKRDIAEEYNVLIDDDDA